MLPKLIVFDLDACFWDTEMKFIEDYPQLVCGHVLAVQSTIGARGDIPIPPKNIEICLHEGAKAAVRAWADDPEFKNVIFACASKTTKPQFSHACLGALTCDGRPVAKMFAREYTHIYPKTKNVHFEAIQRASGVAWKDMLYFDDCTWRDNFADVQALSDGAITCVLTPNGLTEERWKYGLQEFARRNASARPRN